MSSTQHTPGRLRAVPLGGSSTVLAGTQPRRNDTRIPAYGYNEAEGHCLAYPFTDDDGHARLDFVCFSHDDARRLVACWNFCEGVETEAIEEGAANLATLFEGMKAGADSVTAWRQRAQQAVDALAQVETYLQARVDPNGPSTAATKILPMIRKALANAQVAPTQSTWADC